MVYSYLTDIYSAMQQRRQEIEGSIASESDPQAIRRLQGRLDQLMLIEQFLKKNYHHNLPRRLQRQWD